MCFFESPQSNDVVGTYESMQRTGAYFKSPHSKAVVVTGPAAPAAPANAQAASYTGLDLRRRRKGGMAGTKVTTPQLGSPNIYTPGLAKSLLGQ